jgi:hypothetical protein
MDISDNSVPNDNIRLKVLDESVSLNWCIAYSLTFFVCQFQTEKYLRRTVFRKLALLSSWSKISGSVRKI